MRVRLSMIQLFSPPKDFEHLIIIRNRDSKGRFIKETKQ